MTEALINGYRMSYEDGRGAGVPVLFIHGGYGGAMTTLAPMPPVIRNVLPSDQFRVITYDRRGCGASEYCDADYTLEDLAADGAALLDHLGIDKALVVGTSLGGPIALQFALTWPDRVLALCLPNTGPNLMNLGRQVSLQRAELVARVRREGPEAVFESRKHRLREPVQPEAQQGPDAAARREKALAALAAMSDEELFRLSMGEIRNFAAYQGYDFTRRLSELQMPVCVIHGTADQTVPFAWGWSLHDGIPGSAFYPIDGGVHGILSNPLAAEALRHWAVGVASSWVIRTG